MKVKILVKLYHRQFTIVKRSLTRPALSWDQNRNSLTREDIANIERHWHNDVTKPPDPNAPGSSKGKKYVLSMFPYPSGNLHMGHVRVYTIADCLARYYSLSGYDVFQPMGWDAFGLPAENAAIERGENPKDWTERNIETMRKQLNMLSGRFNWECEVSTCRPDYYKWTQWVFLQLYKRGLAYRKKSFVNWDPVDRTVLADEQIDSEGRSWRSGALVEKRLLNQWFVKTTKFAKALHDNLDHMPEWLDVASMQRNWLGDCSLYKFQLDLLDAEGRKMDHFAEVCVQNPTDLAGGLFLAVKDTDSLCKLFPDSANAADKSKSSVYRLSLVAKNPLNNTVMPILCVTSAHTYSSTFAEFQSCKLGVPDSSAADEQLYKEVLGSHAIPQRLNFSAEEVIRKATEEEWGGYICSHKLNDWAVSRQRYWGTPIPIIHCKECGPVAVPECDLPVLLPEAPPASAIGRSDAWRTNQTLLSQNAIGRSSPDAASADVVAPLDACDAWTRCRCPRCGATARRDTHTLDTFFDSSFYYIRYLDAKNERRLCDEVKVQRWMPVDVYVGGKEHAVLHLYFSRFMCHFLKSIGVSPCEEPFRRLMPQGLVLGPTYRLKSNGVAVLKDRVVKSSDDKLIDSTSGGEVELSWEKMSKSRHNGVDPQAVFDEFGSDVTRILMIGFVCPQANRNWSTDTSKGVTRWINRLSYVVQKYVTQRNKRPDYVAKPSVCNEPVEKMLKDNYNRCVQKLTFHNETTFLLNTAFVELIVMTNALRKLPLEMYGTSPQFERCLHSLIIMCWPLMPSIAAEFWSALKGVRSQSDVWNTDTDIWQQKWPEADHDAKMQLVFGTDHDEPIDFVLINKQDIDSITVEKAFELGKRSGKLKKFKAANEIKSCHLKKVEHLGLMMHIDAVPIDNQQTGTNCSVDDVSNDENDETRARNA